MLEIILGTILGFLAIGLIIYGTFNYTIELCVKDYFMIAKRTIPEALRKEIADGNCNFAVVRTREQSPSRNKLQLIKEDKSEE